MTYSEEQIDALVEGVTALVAKLTEQANVEPKGDAEAAEERFAAIEAVRAVESADISEATKARLLEGIKAGDYDVTEAIEAEIALREELREQLEAQILTEAGASARGNFQESANADDYKVNGW